MRSIHSKICTMFGNHWYLNFEPNFEFFHKHLANICPIPKMFGNIIIYMYIWYTTKCLPNVWDFKYVKFQTFSKNMWPNIWLICICSFSQMFVNCYVKPQYLKCLANTIQWNLSMVAPLNNDQPLNKGQMTTMQACYF